MKKFFINSIGCVMLLCIASVASAQFITNNGIRISNSALVVSNGEWINDAGTNILNNGTIQTSESFVNNGSLDGAGNGGFILKFATDLNFRPGGSRMGFLTKDGAGIALTYGTISVSDSLLLKNGLIRLSNATDTISVRSGGLVLGGPTSYVEGMVARAGTGDLLFPVGRDGYYLPVTLYKVDAQKVTASILPAPAGYSAGPGLDSLINFPYVWKIQEKVAADTAGYVEVDYPNTLPTVVNPVVAKETGGLKYASIGARLITTSGGRIVIKSYSRSLKGVYTVAGGFPGDLVTDSLALVALYNATEGPAWTTRTNWLTGDVNTWFGVTVNGQSITALSLPGNNLTGDVPDPLVDIQALQTLNFSGNDITALPDFTLNTEITTLNVSDNRLTYASLEPNATVPGFSFLTQADYGVATDELVPVGSPVEFNGDAGGVSSQYQWKREGVSVDGANAAVYQIPAISKSTMGTYVAEVSNPSLPGLILRSVPQRVIAYANVGGKLMINQNTNATEGAITLFRITTEAFDTVATVPVQNDGSYSFEQVVLDDYQLLGFADTLVHNRALPTYYQNTIFWEEADTLYLENNISDLTIISQLEPGPPSGRGSISGFLEEEVEEGRLKNTKKAKRIEKAGVSARRVENTGRGKEEILTLVAYVFTDENGEFTLPNLPAGEYRINIQYPGYPMDETSFLTIPIGTGLQSQVSVEAHVIDGKINVRKLVITGMHEGEAYDVQVFPNPAVDFVRLNFREESAGRIITLTDMNGRDLQTTAAEGKEVRVNVQQVNTGLYLLRIRENGLAVKTLKLSIE
jgi:hypothetical protein